jgi:hypothetical protein
MALPFQRLGAALVCMSPPPKRAATMISASRVQMRWRYPGVLMVLEYLPIYCVRPWFPLIF